LPSGPLLSCCGHKPALEPRPSRAQIEFAWGPVATRIDGVQGLTNMRRTALLGLMLLLSACQNYVGSPLAGGGGFLGDTFGLRSNPNQPVGQAPNMLLAMGKQVEQQPLTPEPGDVWPGPVAPEPTLQDIQHQQNQPPENLPPAPHPQPRGSSTPPGPASVVLPQPGQPVASPATRQPAAPARTPSARVYSTPSGPAVGTETGNDVRTYVDPKGSMGIVVPNGNGTSTLIAPDGTVTTVPTPR
jgi:hypothetical protein